MTRQLRSTGGSLRLLIRELVILGMMSCIVSGDEPPPVSSQAAVVEPKFSVKSGTFDKPFSLKVTMAKSGVKTVYTTDGSAPSVTNGTIYEGPITIDSSTQVRAAAIIDDQAPVIATGNYVRLAPDLQAYTSALPILIVENYSAGPVPNKGWSSTRTQTGAGIQQRRRQPAYIQIIDRDPDSANASIESVPDFTSRIGIRVRGASSSTWRSKPYSFETWKEDSDADDDTQPLGLPKESDWILYYLNPGSDRTMLYNTFIWEISRETGRYGTRFRFVDVFVNEDGKDLSLADRRGVYALAEKVKRGPDRINFDKLTEDGGAGGWLLSINRMDALPPGGFPAKNGVETPQFFHTAGPDRILQTVPNVAGSPKRIAGRGDVSLRTDDDIPRQYNAFINFENPSGYKMTTGQRAVIENWFRQFEDVFYDDALWRDPEKGYRKYIDTRDFIDYFHLLNLAKQSDGLLLSMFPWVSSGDRKLHMGPMWDFNNGAYGSDTDSPLYFRRDRLWYPRLFADPDFVREYKDRWHELRRGPLATAKMIAIIDRQAAEITESLAIAQGLDASTWNDRLTKMKTNLSNRAAWLDAQYRR